MSAHTEQRRTFVGSATIASGDGPSELVPQSAREAISHPAPTALPYSVEKIERETKCYATDVLHQCAMPKGHEGAHHCIKCDHAWACSTIDTFRAATSDNDLCWFKSGDFDMGSPL